MVELNRDVESFLIQASAQRTMFFNDPFEILQFVHFSDVHAVPQLWERIVEYINHYASYISFGLHTGDYCGGSQEEYVDFYNQCTASRGHRTSKDKQLALVGVQIVR